jgi:acetyl-CoA/propionyl-CoA carboxylase biotin carboxyl carrier protein
MVQKSVEFKRVLVANRGEIAIRVFRTLAELEIEGVAVFSDADADSLHVRYAQHAVHLGPPPPAESYLKIDAVIEAALHSGADAVHPGYGFLAENAEFARACEAAGLVWIGPPVGAIERMGSKTASRALMQAAGVAIVPGSIEAVDSPDAAREDAKRIGYPVAVKARSGGGGKGFRVALSEDDLEAAFAGASGEGERYFGDAGVYLERYLPDPRHVEVQILADGHGTVVHMGERDCSIQRRHQKLVEECPAPTISDDTRHQLYEIAIGAAQAVDYRGAGTVECLVGPDGSAYFLEMNTRVQVEHTITEMCTGIDIVAEQIRVAEGLPLSFTQDDVRLRGHAIECRINAEDAAHGFRPSSGHLYAYREPAGFGVRVDSGVVAGSEVSPFYDTLLAKLITWGRDRDAARRRMIRALQEFEIEGVETLLPFHAALLEREEFIDAETCRELCDRPEQLVEAHEHDEHEAGGPPLAPKLSERRTHTAGAGGEVAAPIPGNVLRVDVTQGDEVSIGQLLCVLEAMKMENEIVAPVDGTVELVPVGSGESVAAGQLLVRIAPGD